MADPHEDALQELARIAADSGPAIVPAGHLELLSSITTAAKDIFGAAACSMALLSDTQEELIFHVASGEGADDVVGMRIPSSQGIAGWVVTSGQPIAIEDVQQDPRFARDFAEQTGYVPRSILAMPLETDRRMLGVISVLDRRSSPDRNDMELLSLFATQAALAIENSRVFTDMGTALFRAAAAAAGEGSHLSETLQRIADTAPDPSDDLAEIAAAFTELGRAGSEERRAAARIVTEFLRFVNARKRLR